MKIIIQTSKSWTISPLRVNVCYSKISEICDAFMTNRNKKSQSLELGKNSVSVKQAQGLKHVKGSEQSPSVARQ